MELYQVSIFGEKKIVAVKANNNYKPKKLSKKNQILKNKIEILYDLYERLYDMQEISILEPREIIKRGNIIMYTEDRQAEPIETINMNIIDDIDKRIEITEKEVERYEQLKFEFMKEFV